MTASPVVLKEANREGLERKGRLEIGGSKSLCGENASKRLWLAGKYRKNIQKLTG
jgi:hypothetical protein